MFLALTAGCDPAPGQTGADGAGAGAGSGIGAAAGAPASAAEIEAPPVPGTVVWALAESPRTLDPARNAIDPGGIQVAAQVYDRLFHLSRSEPFQIEPGLAEDWEVDPTGRTYTFTLREGVRFHDGTRLDAPAVKWNLERWANPEHEAHAGDFRAWRSMFGGTSVEDDGGDGGPAPNLVQRIEALDSQTLRITLQAPFAPFIRHLAMVPFGIASPAAVRAQGEQYGADDAHLPVGSGPFRAVAWARETGVVILAPFEDHWRGAPASPGLRFVTVPDDAARADLVAQGGAHGTHLAPTATVSRPLAAELEGDPSLVIRPVPARTGAWLMLNHNRPPLDQLAVREAFDLAIDREALAAEHFGLAAMPQGQILPPGFLGYAPDVESPPRDVERARAILAEAGFEDGFRLIITVPSTPRPYLPDPIGTGGAVAGMLREIGIDADIRSETLRKFLSRRASGRSTAWLIGWEAQSPDPDNIWYYHFSPSRLASEGHYDNRNLFDILLRAQRAISSDERGQLYAEAAAVVYDDVPRIFLAHARPVAVLSPLLIGYDPGGMGFDDLAPVALSDPSATPVTPLGTDEEPGVGEDGDADATDGDTDTDSRPGDAGTSGSDEAAASPSASPTASPSSTEPGTGAVRTAAPLNTAGPTTSP